MKYIIQFVNCDGSGFIKVDKPGFQSSPWDENREWDDLEEAKAYADEQQHKTDESGNAWHESYIVKTTTYRTVYRTR